MEIRHLHYFVAVVESGSFSAAAERLGIAQPPLGRQMRDLEASVGATLFERSNKGVRLTLAGAGLLRRARDILHDVGVAREEARLVAQGGAGRLTVGYADEFLYGLLPVAALRFARRHQDVHLSLEMDYNVQTAVAVEEGRCDVGLIIAPPPSHLGSIVVRSIDRVPLHVMLPHRHVLAGRQGVAVRDLAAERIMTGRFMPTSGYYVRLMELLRASGMNLDLHTGIHPTEMIAQLVAAGQGVALVSPDAVSPTRDDIVLKPLSDPDAILERCVIWRADTPNPLTRSFVDLVVPPVR